MIMSVVFLLRSYTYFENQYFINQGFASPRVFSNYGVILRELGNFKEAESSTRKAIQLNPNFADAHYNLGNILKDLGNLKEAELSTRKAIKLNPNFAQAHSNLGIILKELGNSFIFQELDFSLKVGATRKALLKEYNKVRKDKNSPDIYTNDERGFNNWMADQFSIALKKELKVPIGDTDTTLKNYESMNGATKGWFKRLIKNLIALYNTITPQQRFRYQEW